MIEARSKVGSAQRSLSGASALATLDGHNLVFSEVHQAIYELDDLSVFVWRCLDAQLGPEQIVNDLVDTGVARSQARDAVAAVLMKLRDLHRPATSSSHASEPVPMERLAPLTLLISGVAVQLHVSKSLLADVQAAFGHLCADLRETEVQLCVRATEASVYFLPPGRPEWSCERSHFVPVLKAELIDRVLRCARYEVALHAAAVAHGDGMVLLVGSPGAGKTTLCIALSSAGFDAVSDDVVLIDRDRRARGLPFALTAKAPAWSLISRVWPGLPFEPSYERPDRQTVAYLGQIPLAFRPRRRIAFVILLNRQDHVAARIQNLDPTHVLTALIEEGATQDERLSATGFETLVGMLQEARCCRLTYSNLADAVEAVRSLHL